MESQITTSRDTTVIGTWMAYKTMSTTTTDMVLIITVMEFQITKRSMYMELTQMIRTEMEFQTTMNRDTSVTTTWMVSRIITSMVTSVVISTEMEFQTTLRPTPIPMTRTGMECQIITSRDTTVTTTWMVYKTILITTMDTVLIITAMELLTTWKAIADTVLIITAMESLTIWKALTHTVLIIIVMELLII
jgi:hypothetical protein